MKREIPNDRDLREIPQAKAKAKARPSSRSLADYASIHSDRNSAIAPAYGSGGYTMRDIGDYFGVHYSGVSRIVRAAERAGLPAKRKT